MMVGSGVSVSSDGRLNMLGETILSDVHDNIILMPAARGILTNGDFIGVQSDRISGRMVFPVGKLQDLRFMCVFQFKLWWMTHRMDTSGQDIPFEIQFLIVEGLDGSHFGKEGNEQPALYIVFLPILEGDFRAVLQGNANNELEICLESEILLCKSLMGAIWFVAAGSDPFDVITNAVKDGGGHLQTFAHRDIKKVQCRIC
ncbi:hypothetical protein OROMI_024172 [Orobanche minor]